MDRTHLYGVKKVYTCIDYEDNDFIIFDYCKQYMPETQFGMKFTGFLQLRQIQIAGVFKKCFWTYLPFFSMIDLNNARIKQLPKV